MGRVHDICLKYEKDVLNELKKRRAVIDRGIAELEETIQRPYVPLNIDFGAIREEARKDMEFLEKCERERIEKQGGIYERRL